MNNRKIKILIVSGLVVAVLLVIGSVLWAKKKSSPSLPNSDNTPNNPNNNPPPSENPPPSDNEDNDDQSEDKNNKNKTEIKLFWGGQSPHDSLNNYWVFNVSWDKLNDPKTSMEEASYYIAKNSPLLQGKKLDQKGLSYTLSYSEQEVVKKPARIKDKNDDEELIDGTILESGFDFKPNGSWEDHSDFEKAWKNPQEVKLVNLNSNGNYIFAHSDPLKKDTKFLVESQNPVLKKLSLGKEYYLRYGKVDKINGNNYFFNQFNRELNLWNQEH